jgi:hypothetical protein
MEENDGMTINIPRAGYKGRPRTKQLGQLLHNIRSGNTSINDEMREFLNGHGFIYSFTDLAVHIARRRNVSVTALHNLLHGELAEDFVALERALRNLPMQRKLRALCSLDNAGLQERFAQDLARHLKSGP